jgi:hypothetical protein
MRSLYGWQSYSPCFVGLSVDIACIIGGHLRIKSYVELLEAISGLDTLPLRMDRTVDYFTGIIVVIGNLSGISL